MKQSDGNLYKSLLPLQALVPRKDRWRVGNVAEKGDGTCEVPINIRFVPVNKPSVAANKQKDDYKEKCQVIQILIPLNKIFPRKKI